MKGHRRICTSTYYFVHEVFNYILLHTARLLYAPSSHLLLGKMIDSHTGKKIFRVENMICKEK